jgi:3-keto-disaccharide hydrolase
MRRRDLCLAGFLSACGARITQGQEAARKPDGFRPLFDGVSLRGWTRKERELARPSLGRWTVEDGVIIGGQDPPGSGLGSYLVTDQSFGDFELQIEARPDWPADTGILLRTVPQGNVGFQVLLDHRPHGGIGGYYGNGLGGFHAWDYGFTAEKDKDGRLLRLIPEKPNEPAAANYTVPLDFAAPAEVFLRIWKVGDWNHFRIRCAGALPRLTTWINGEKISELDTAAIKAPKYDPKAVLEKLGRAGHIALEVHSNGPTDKLGKDRWAPGAVCRWRNISVRTL